MLRRAPTLPSRPPLPRPSHAFPSSTQTLSHVSQLSYSSAPLRFSRPAFSSDPASSLAFIPAYLRYNMPNLGQKRAYSEKEPSHDEPLPSTPKNALPTREDEDVIKHRIEHLMSNMRHLSFYIQNQSAKSKILGWVLLFALLLTFLLWEPIKDWWGQQGADVASRSLSHEDVQMRAEELSKAVLHQVLTDPEISNQSVLFLKGLFSREDTQQAVITLLSAVLSDDVAVQRLKVVFNNLILHVLDQDETMQVATEFFSALLAKPAVEQAAAELAERVLNTQSVREKIRDLSEETVKSEAVVEASRELSYQVVRALLNDEDIKRHAEAFVTEMIKDPSLQNEAAGVLWETVMATVTPRWLAKKKDPLETITDQNLTLREKEGQGENANTLTAPQGI